MWMHVKVSMRIISPSLGFELGTIHSEWERADTLTQFAMVPLFTYKILPRAISSLFDGCHN